MNGNKMLKRFLLALDDELLARIRKAAVIEGLSASAFIRNAITWRLKELKLLGKMD